MAKAYVILECILMEEYDIIIEAENDAEAIEKADARWNGFSRAERLNRDEHVLCYGNLRKDKKIDMVTARVVKEYCR